MEQRLSVITLGVSDLSRARTFYEALGWRIRCEPESEVVFFQAGGIAVALWSRASLAADSGVTDGNGWGGVTLAYNVSSPADVDRFLTEAADAGAAVPRWGAETFWGGYSGVFVDPDGHPWEVAHRPALDARRGRLDPSVARPGGPSRVATPGLSALVRATPRGPLPTGARYVRRPECALPSADN
jgi:predicted lactoylglutathione lyase